MKRLRLHPHVLSVACLALLGLVYTWPLASQLRVAIPGTARDHDVATMVWNVGWITRAMHGQADPLFSGAVLLPFGADLRLHTYGLLQGVLAYPFTLTLGVVGAFNLVVVGTLVANAATTYALVYREARSAPAALLAAAWLALGTPVVFYLQTGRPAVGSLWIVAAALLAARDVLGRASMASALALGILLVAALFSDFQVVLFTVLWLLLYGACRLWCDGRLLLSRARPVALLVTGLTVGVPFFLVYYPALANAGASGYPRPPLAAMQLYSFRWWDYVTPALIPVVYGGYELFGGALAAVALFGRQGRYRFWLAGTLGFLLLALGPYLQPTRIPLPFAALSMWAPLSQFRTPGRLVAPAAIGLAVVAGLAVAHLLRRVRSRWLVAALVGVAAGGRLLVAVTQAPFQVQPYPEYATYRQIAAESGDFALLEVPFGVRSGLERIGTGGETLQYYQHVHGKRLINAMVARLPASIFDFYRAHPSLLLLSGEPVSADEATLQADFGEVLRWSNARYVLVHGSLLTAEQAARIESFLDRQPDLERAWMEGDLIVYRLNRPRAAPE